METDIFYAPITQYLKFPSLSRSGLKVPGGVVWWGVVWCGLKPILVFSLSLSQAEQLKKKRKQVLSQECLTWKVFVYFPPPPSARDGVKWRG